MNTKLYNIKECELSLSSELPGWSNIDVMDKGIPEDGTVEFNFPTDQAIYKEDVTGQYGQMSFLNSNKVDIKIAVMHGSPLHDWINGVWREGKAYGMCPINASFKDPLTGEMYIFNGAIKEKPSIKIQTEIQSLEVNLVGGCTILPTDMKDFASEMAKKKISGI